MCVAVLSQLVPWGSCDAQLGEFIQLAGGIVPPPPPPSRRELVAVDHGVATGTPPAYAASYAHYALRPTAVGRIPYVPLTFNNTNSSDTETLDERTERRASAKHAEDLHPNGRHPLYADAEPISSAVESSEKGTELHGATERTVEMLLRNHPTAVGIGNYHRLKQDPNDKRNADDVVVDQVGNNHSKINFEKDVSSTTWREHEATNVPLNTSNESSSNSNDQHHNAGTDNESEVISTSSENSGRPLLEINNPYNEDAPVHNNNPELSHAHGDGEDGIPANRETKHATEDHERKVTPASVQADDEDEESERDTSRSNQYMGRRNDDIDYDEDDDTNDDDYDDYDDGDDERYSNRRMSRDRNVRTRDSQGNNLNQQKRDSYVTGGRLGPHERHSGSYDNGMEGLGNRRTVSGRAAYLERPPVSNDNFVVSNRPPTSPVHSYMSGFDDDEDGDQYESYYRALQDWPQGDSHRIIPKTRVTSPGVGNGYRNEAHLPHTVNYKGSRQEDVPKANQAGTRGHSNGYVTSQVEPPLVYKASGSQRAFEPGYRHRNVIAGSGKPLKNYDERDGNRERNQNIRVGKYQGNNQGFRAAVDKEKSTVNNGWQNEYLNNQEITSPNLKQEGQSQASPGYGTNRPRTTNGNELLPEENVIFKNFGNPQRGIVYDLGNIDTGNGLNSGMTDTGFPNRNTIKQGAIRQPLRTEKTTVRTLYGVEDGRGAQAEADEDTAEEQGPGPELQSEYAAVVAARRGTQALAQGGETARVDNRRGTRGRSKQGDNDYRRGQASKAQRDTRDWEEYGKRREYHYKLGDKELAKVLGPMPRAAQGGGRRSSRARPAAVTGGERFLHDSINMYVFGWRK